MGLVNNQQAYDAYLLCPDGHGNIELGEARIGYRFQMRMPNFRGNYLSCVEELSLWLDDEPVDTESVELLLNGKRFRIQELPDLYKEYWDVNDCAVVEVLRPDGLGGRHTLRARMRMRYGYSAYFGVCKVVTSQCERAYTFPEQGGDRV